ncbi:unnamed protein product [Camellia sinensis]
MTGVFEHKKRKQPESNNSIPGNPFEIVNVSPSTPVNTDSTELRISDDPKKLLALLAAFVGLFTNHSKDDVSAGQDQDQDPPSKILANVALLLGLSAAAAANGDATPPVNGSIEHRGALRKDEEEEEEEEDGYRQRSKKQRIILDLDAESIPDSSQCTPPPTKSEGSTGYSPDSIVSAASVANRSRITRSSEGKFRRQLPVGNPNICENNLAIVHQPVEHPAVKEAFDSVRETLQPILLQKVTRIRKDELTVEFGLETTASIDLLNLVNASIHGLEEIG